MGITRVELSGRLALVCSGCGEMRGELEGDVLGHTVAYVSDHYVGGEAPGIISVHDDLRAGGVVACLAGLPALVENACRDDEGAKGRQELCQHRDVQGSHVSFLGFSIRKLHRTVAREKGPRSNLPPTPERDSFGSRQHQG